MASGDGESDAYSFLDRSLALPPLQAWLRTLVVEGLIKTVQAVSDATRCCLCEVLYMQLISAAKVPRRQLSYEQASYVDRMIHRVSVV